MAARQEARSGGARAEVAAPEPPPPPPSPENQELSWEDVRPVDAVGLEVGYRLVPLVDRTKGGDLLARIRGIRRKLTQELGFLVQAVHIRDNLELGPNTYRIRLAGVAIGESVVHPDRELAINPGRVFGPVNGLATRDPAFGMEAVWIEPNLREHAQSLGYTVVDAATVIATHLSHLIQSHAHELFGHEEAEQLLKNLAKTAPKLVDELVPKVLPLAVVVRVMQGLLAERVPIRNVRAIVEALAEAGPRSQDPQVLHRRRSGLPWAGRSSRTSSVSPKSCPSSHLSQNSSAYCQTASRIRPQARVWSPGWQSACNVDCQRPRNVKNVAVNRRCC